MNSRDVLTDRRFWAVAYGEMLGQVSEPVDPGIIYSLLDVDEKDAQGWFCDVTGIGGGEDGGAPPKAIRVPLGRDFELAIVFELGDVIWLLRDPVRGAARLGNIGGHWELPGVRWEEAVRIANASPDLPWAVTLLLLLLVWLTDGDDARAVRGRRRVRVDGEHARARDFGIRVGRRLVEGRRRGSQNSLASFRPRLDLRRAPQHARRATRRRRC